MNSILLDKLFRDATYEYRCILDSWGFYMLPWHTGLWVIEHVWHEMYQASYFPCREDFYTRSLPAKYTILSKTPFYRLVFCSANPALYFPP